MSDIERDYWGRETANGLVLLDRAAVCEYFGGKRRPINAATLYRGIRKGRYPKPIKIGPGSSRWILEECEDALEEMRGRR